MAAHPLSEYVASRRIGEATITVICEGELTWAPELQVPETEWRRALPEANARGELSFDCNVVHLAIDGASILLDPGFADPSSPQQPESGAPTSAVRRTPGLHAALAGIGVRPDEISHVLISHAHDDHFAGVMVERHGRHAARFPRARHLLARRDWEGNPERAQPDSELMRHLGTIERLGLLDLVDGDREVVPGVTMIHAPGETPGHTIVRVRSAGESFYYVGDLFHHPCEVAHLDWVSAGRDQAAMRSSRERLLAEAVPRRATIVYAHAPFPAWGRMVRADSGYRWERV